MFSRIISFFRRFRQGIDFQYFKQQANEGDVEAQFNLGNCYASGQGTHLDHDMAAIWWKKAADQGHADAEYNLNHLEKLRRKLSAGISVPVLTEEGLVTQHHSTEELLSDIRAFKKENTNENIT